jgi:hypothetical protein
MVKENYETPEMLYSSLILGEYVKRSVNDLKKELPKENQKIIVYQLEPLVSKHLWSVDNIINNIRDADEVWDYDLQNIEILNRHGIDAKFKPMRFTRSLQRITNLENPDIDLLFFGGMTDYRNKFLNWFWNGTDPKVFYNLNFVWLKNIVDSKLDEFIGRSKIILNLNPYDGETRQQQTRIFYALINNKCVVSQSSPINYFGDSIIEFTNPHSLNNVLQLLLSNDAWRNKSLNYNRSFAFQHSNIAIFFNISDCENWSNLFDSTIVDLQYSSWYDRSDYIHIGLESHLILPYNLMKVNRYKRIEFGNDTLMDMLKFAKLNPNYKILYIDNQFERQILSQFKFQEIIDQLDQVDLVYTSADNRNFAARSDYIASLDITALDEVLSQNQFLNWLKKE